MMRFKIFCVAAAMAIAAAGPALAAPPDEGGSAPAVSRDPGRGGSFEILIGGELLTPQALGSRTATLTSNNNSGSAYNYFSVDNTRAVAPAFNGRIGYNITSMFSVEGGLVYSRGDVRGSVSGDVESVPALTVAERMTQYFVDVSVLAHLRKAAFSNGAGVPFLEAGAGYLRQMHEGNQVTNTGQIYHFGGGVTYLFRQRPTSRLTAMGLRVAARIYIPRKGYTVGNAQQVFAGVGGGLVFLF